MADVCVLGGGGAVCGDLRDLVDHLTLPPCVAYRRVAGIYRAPDSPPFVPSRVASGRCALTAAAAGVPCGVISASAGPSSWRTGGQPVVVGVVVQFSRPTHLRSAVVHRLPRRVSVCVRRRCPTPPRAASPPPTPCEGHTKGQKFDGNNTCRGADKGAYL